MFMNPYISSRLADERRRDMLADAQHRSLVRRACADPGSTWQLTQRLHRHLRVTARPRTAAVA
jgi:hypothetical protein